MTLVATTARWLAPLLNLPPLRRIRRNHALEHATIHLLNRQRYTLSGHSSENGFVIVGDVPTARLESAVKEALRRLRGGERHLAIHPNCGTNLVTTALLTTTIGAAGFIGSPRRTALDRFPYVMLLVMLALLYGPRLGTALQQHITTDGDPGDMEYIGLERSELRLPLVGRLVLHHVTTLRG
ncbi:MAG: DUF6391 domain-containing protein [Anaerolineae bacterium]|jgi:hypothetical protein|nr:DUF6391 domain-containing protein [Anaerolineae bacterium]